MFLCCMCDHVFASVELLVQHLTYNHRVINMLSRYRCRQNGCFQSCDSLAQFKRHLLKCHRNDGNIPEVHANAVDHDDPVNPGVDGFVEEGAEHHVDNGVDDGFVEEGDEAPHEPAQDHVEVSLEDFVRAICKNAAILSARLGSVPNMNRQDASLCISLFSDFLQSGIVNVVKQKVMSVLNNHVDENILFDIREMFNLLENPLESISSEYKRLQGAERDGFYIRPEPYLLCHRDVYAQNDENVVLERKAAHGQHVPLRRSLKCFLELPGIFNLIQNFIRQCENTPDVVQNFVQGDLWQAEVRDFTGEYLLPLHLHFDDYQFNNSNGSHVHEGELGALYASLPCLPPPFQNSVENMFVASLFLSRDRKNSTDAVVFGPVIDELIYLRNVGIVLQIQGINVRVFFAFKKIIADNKGNNSIQGFVESFRANYFCRICKMHRNDTKHICRIPDNLLRNFDNYTADVNLRDLTETGVKQECVWNRVPGYHVVDNISCDLFHDFNYGLLRYGVCAVLNNFINTRNYFDLDTFKDRIESFNYGPSEKGNKPPSCKFSVERLESSSLNLSGSEMLCLGRYLPQMIGDLVPKNNKVWEFYGIVHEILLLVYSPHYIVGTELYLDSLIRQHNELYVSLFHTNLKPKHHIMMHYKTLYQKSGPLVHISTLTSERKHRLGKLYMHAMNSRINPPLSIAVKLQLEMCEYLANFKEPKSVSHGLRQCAVGTLHNYCFFGNLLNIDAHIVVSVVQSVNILGTYYNVGMVVVVRYSDLYPVFGTIAHILLDNQNVIFIIKMKETVDYHSHYCSYEVKDTNVFIRLSQVQFASYLPLWQRAIDINGEICDVVSLRCSL